MSAVRNPKLRFEGAPFDPSLYPRIYPISTGWRIFSFVFGALFGIGGTFAAVYFSSDGRSRDAGATAVLIVVFLSFVGCGAYVFANALRWRMTLGPDFIRVDSVFSSRTLQRNQIRGVRVIAQKNSESLSVEPRDASLKRMKFALTINRDAEFEAWFADFPDLDAEELGQSEASAEADPELGATPEDRKVNLNQSRQLAKRLTWASWAAVLWGWVYPQPYVVAMAVLAAFPLAVIFILARDRGLFQIEGRKNEARADIIFPFLFTSLVLAFRSFDVHFVAWRPIFVQGAGLALVFMFLALGRNKHLRERWQSVVILLVASFLLAVGGIGLTDRLLDHSDPTTYQVTALGKRISSGRSTTYYLRVSGWELEPQGEEISVPSGFYGAVHTGQTLCIYVRPGAMRIPWYLPGLCG